MKGRLVLLHGWGADGDDLRPLGNALNARMASTLEVVSLEAPTLQAQGSGRQWYGLFPADWDAVPAAVSQLQQRLTTGNRPQGMPPGAGPAGVGGVPMGGMMPQNPRMGGMVPQPGQVRE